MWATPLNVSLKYESIGTEDGDQIMDMALFAIHKAQPYLREGHRPKRRGHFRHDTQGAGPAGGFNMRSCNGAETTLHSADPPISVLEITIQSRMIREADEVDREFARFEPGSRILNADAN